MATKEDFIKLPAKSGIYLVKNPISGKAMLVRQSIFRIDFVLIITMIIRIQITHHILQSFIRLCESMVVGTFLK